MLRAKEKSQRAISERRLGQLPGFTPERIDRWLEVYPADVLGLPIHTGSPPVRDASGKIISTPVPEEAGPDIFEARPEEPTRVRPNDDPSTQRVIRRENDSAEVLKENGFNVLQNPVVAGPKNPDYLINGEVYDHYAPETEDARAIWRTVEDKVNVTVRSPHP